MAAIINSVLRFARGFDTDRKEDWSEQQSVQRREIIGAALCDIFNPLYYSPDPYISAETAERFGIVVRKMNLAQNASFWRESYCSGPRPELFKPMFASVLELLPINEQNKRTQAAFKILDRVSVQAEKGIISAGIVSKSLSVLFCEVERVPAKENGMIPTQQSLTLQEWSGWVHIPPKGQVRGSKYMSPTDPDNPDNISPTPWGVQYGDSFLRDDSRPHRTVILEHAAPFSEDLHRSEVLTIIGLMRERLAGQTLQQHKFIPIQIISCTEDMKARVLQAHFEDGRLNIWKSTLHSFQTEEERLANLPLFLLYLAATPTGNTVF
ncbi:hypothetical protein BJX64DRAFT_289869 [Aspergillus heterothallicus]